MPETSVRTPVLMQGNEAVVEGALAAGLTFFAGYPITPSSEVAELLSERLPRAGGRFIQMEDEIASMAAVIGGALTGAHAMTATSGPGFSLMQENLGYAAHSEIPCVIVNVQRMGPSTGLPTSPAQGDVLQTRSGSHGDYPMIALCPASVSESYHLTVQAFRLAERFRTPVVLLMDEVIGHLREGVILPEAGEVAPVQRREPPAPPGEHKAYAPGPDGVPLLPRLGTGYRFHVTGLIHGEDGFPTSKPAVVERTIRRLTDKVNGALDSFYAAEKLYLEDAEVAVVAYGCTARSAQKAVRLARAGGIKAGLYRPITIWPFHYQAVGWALASARSILVPELNLGQMAGEVERAVRSSTPVRRLGKVTGTMLTPTEILAAIREVA